jgi:5-methylcytosine-specific restriction endonuclease McrA
MGRNRRPLDTLKSPHYARNRDLLLSRSQARRDQARSGRPKYHTPFRIAAGNARREAREQYLAARLQKLCEYKSQPFNITDKRPPRPRTALKRLEKAQKDSAIITARARANKAFFVKKLGGKCVKCGFAKHLAALEFDHINPYNKRYQIALILSRVDQDRIWLEVQKCQLLCANCHRIKTYETRDHAKQRRYLEARQNALQTVQNTLGTTISPSSEGVNHLPRTPPKCQK